MELTPQAVYQQSTDQQRILIAGPESARLTKFVRSILDMHHRNYDHVADSKLSKMKNAPVILIESTTYKDIIAFKHHALVLTPNGTESNQLNGLLDSTPKSGIIIYPETDASLKSLAKKERADVQTVSYKTIPHEVKDGKTFLVSSSNEKFPVKINGSSDLLLLAAAKELVKKIGISSGQFYKAATTLE
jgi:UDP-N-acetylmuramate: L-alanyl-gamma-D-glutamyl-meso-diaminopimelate ligase